jgi:hypothetical protein
MFRGRSKFRIERKFKDSLSLLKYFEKKNNLLKVL